MEIEVEVSFHQTQRRLLQNDAKLHYICLEEQNIRNDQIQLLSKLLKHNTTVTFCKFTCNDLTCVAATHLSNCLVNNTSIIELYLDDNQIGNQGSISLSTSLCQNQCLKVLNMAQNDIEVDGALALSRMMCKNTIMKELWLQWNPIQYKGKIGLLNAMRCNKSIIKCVVHWEEESRDGKEDHEIQQELNDMTRWNEIEDVYNWTRKSISIWNYRDHIVYIIVILDQMPICSDLHWNIIEMLRVNDVVSEENRIFLQDMEYQSIESDGDN